MVPFVKIISEKFKKTAEEREEYFHVILTEKSNN